MTIYFIVLFLLISTHYDKTEPTYKMEYTGGNDNDIEARVKTPLEGNGDFRNQECYNQLHSPTPGDFYTNLIKSMCQIFYNH